MGGKDSGLVLEKVEGDGLVGIGELRLARLMTLPAVEFVACALALLPAVVGVSIVIRSTVPLEFAAAACLTLLAATTTFGLLAPAAQRR